MSLWHSIKKLTQRIFMNSILIWESNRGLEYLPLSEAGYREIWGTHPDKIQAKRMLTTIRGKFLDQYRLQNVSLYEEVIDFFALHTKNNRFAYETAKKHLACLELIFQANLDLDSFVNFSEKHKYYLEEYFSKLTHQPYRKIFTSMGYVDLLVNYYQKGINPNLLLSKPKNTNKVTKVKNPNYENSPLFTKENLAMSLEYYHSCQEKTQYKTLVLEFMGKILKIKDVWCLDKTWIEKTKNQEKTS